MTAYVVMPFQQIHSMDNGLVSSLKETVRTVQRDCACDDGETEAS